MGRFAARGRVFPLTRPYVMGILNVTPDSFSDGGRYCSPELALARGLELQAQGADVIDLGGQSTRPGFTVVPWQEEWNRLKDVLPLLLRELDVPLSVDTFYPQVAEKALAAGAHIVNDVTGFGKEMLRAAAGSGCGCVVNCPLGGQGGEVLAATRRFFQTRLEDAARLGFSQEQLCFDPGVGFGTDYEEDLALLANAGSLRVGGCALLVGASRKRVTARGGGGENAPLALEDRLAPTLAAHTAAALSGADFLRAHDVKEAVTAARMAGALRGKITQEGRGQTMDTIWLKGLEIFAYHGVNPEEKEQGQRFLLDLELQADLRKARGSDDLRDTVNYAGVRKTVQRVFTGAKYDLIERAAQVVCQAVLREHPLVQAVTLTLKKPEAPMNAVFDYAGVTITLRRGEEESL